MLKDRPRRQATSKTVYPGRSVRATHPNHIWNVDLTTVPTAMGFWRSWLPWALPQRWPFCWRLVVALDHFSGRVMGFAVFERQPTSAVVRTFLGRIIRTATASTDTMALARQHGIKPRKEIFPLAEVNAAVAKMMEGTVRFRAMLRVAEAEVALARRERSGETQSLPHKRNPSRAIRRKGFRSAAGAAQ